MDQFYTNLFFPRPIALRKFFEYYEVIKYTVGILFTVGVIKPNEAHKALWEIFKPHPITFDHLIIIFKKNEPFVYLYYCIFQKLYD